MPSRHLDALPNVRRDPTADVLMAAARDVIASIDAATGENMRTKAKSLHHELLNSRAVIAQIIRLLNDNDDTTVNLCVERLMLLLPESAKQAAAPAVEAV